MPLVEVKEGEYIAACDFEFKVNKEGDFDGDWENNTLKQFKKGDKLKQSIAVRLLLRNPELVVKSDGTEPLFEEVKKTIETRKPTRKELESDWSAKNKYQQIAKLKNLGVSDSDIAKLRTEKDRVAKIAELMLK